MLGILGTDLNYANKSHRITSRKLNVAHLKVVLVTSLFWILFDTIIIYNYLLDCFSAQNCQNVRADLPNEVAAHIPIQVETTDDVMDLLMMRKKKLGRKFRVEQTSPKSLIDERTENEANVQDDHDELVKLRDSNEFGKDGVVVNIPEALKERAKETFHINQFNLVASDLIHQNRSLPDIRPWECREKVYPIDSLPNTSVVIVFHNEAWSTLTRTIWSVVNRSPRRLLREIVLVDDASERDFLGKKLEDHLSLVPVPTRLERMGNRSGLVRSRLRGVSVAKGQTVTFLDAHCECTPGWLEPLLYQVYLDRKSVISPLIDVITDNNFEYRLVPDLLAGFDWKVNFDWVAPSHAEVERRKNDSTLPYRTPTMAGGLLTIDRNYFYEVGSYDDQMNIWGGENLEMSFRLWQCGGQVLISPCSRVGHVFRNLSPYSFPEGSDRTVFVNQMRAVELWLGDHKKFYYKSNPAAKGFPIGSLSERVALRDGLKCRDFRWYLKNVYPNSPLPVDFYSVGHIRNIKMGVCIHVSTDGADALTMKQCFFEVDRQVFSYTSDMTLKTLGKMCLTTAGLFTSHVRLDACSSPPNPNQVWHYHSGSFSIENVHINKCLSVEVQGEEQSLTLAPCNGSDMIKWVLEDFDEEKYKEEVLSKSSSPAT